MSSIGHDESLRERLAALRARADRHPAGTIDCYVGTPCDPVPQIVDDAVMASIAQSGPYPMSPGSIAYRDAASRWITRRFSVDIGRDGVAACVGTKEFVASLPRFLRAAQLVGAERDTVLLPSIAYPTYAVGAQLAGMRAVAVPLDDDWLLDLDVLDPDDVARAAVLWLNVPGNPTASVAPREHFETVAAWGRAHDVLVVSDECYVEFADAPHSIVETGLEGVLALHSLSKRSNFAGMRAGFYAGDPNIVARLVDVRREAGLIVPTPVQAATIAALDDDAHVQIQAQCYVDRRTFVLERLAAHGIVHCGGAMPMYLWLRESDAGRDRSGLDLAERFADAGWLLAPGSTFGAAGSPYARLALVQPDDRLHEALDRFDQLAARNP
mgnify:CR=1 FL=1